MISAFRTSPKLTDVASTGRWTFDRIGDQQGSSRRRVYRSSEGKRACVNAQRVRPQGQEQHGRCNGRGRGRTGNGFTYYCHICGRPLDPGGKATMHPACQRLHKRRKISRKRQLERGRFNARLASMRCPHCGLFYGEAEKSAFRSTADTGCEASQPLLEGFFASGEGRINASSGATPSGPCHTEARGSENGDGNDYRA